MGDKDIIARTMARKAKVSAQDKVITYPVGGAQIPIYILHTEDPTEVIKTTLRRGYTFIFLSELVDAIDGKGTLPPKPAILTLDDCRTQLLSVQHPVILSYGIKANLMVISDYTYGLAVDSSVPAGSALSWSDLRTLRDTGLYEFQNHTKRHVALGNQTVAAEALEAIVSCSDAIVSELGVKRPVALAYPNGNYQPATFPVLQQAGIKLAMDYSVGVNTVSKQPSIIGSFPYTYNRISSSTNECLLNAYDDVIYEWSFDATGQRNASNKLGYWSLPGGGQSGGGSVGAQGLRLDSRTITTEQIISTTDFFYVNPFNIIYSRFKSNSESQTAGTAGIRIAQYDKDRVLISKIPLRTYTASEGYLMKESETILDTTCRYIKLEIYADASYDGILNVWNGLVKRV